MGKMRLDSAASGSRSSALVFYACLGTGAVFFAGLKTAAVLVAMLGSINGLLSLCPGLRKPFGSAAMSLTARSLLGLGVLPFFWLLLRPIPDPWFLVILGLLLGTGTICAILKGAPADAAVPGDRQGMIFVLILVFALTAVPFSRIGAPIDGQHAYRAYFSSDYLKHISLVETLNRGGIPPANPYFKGEALHYYWLPYAFPAVAARISGEPARAMYGFSFFVNFLFLFLLFQEGRRICPGKKWVGYLLPGLVLAPSLEGIYFWAVNSHYSLERFCAAGRDVNIDGLTRWLWNLPQIDTLLRSLFYTPQHLLSLAFLLLFLTALPEEKDRTGLLSGALALSLASSFFVGGILLLAWAGTLAAREVIRLLRKQTRIMQTLTTLARHFLPSAAVLALAFALRMATFGGSRFIIQVPGPASILILLGLNLGLLTVGAVWGMFSGRTGDWGFQAVLLGVSAAFALFVQVAGFESDISLKAGLIVILTCALLTLRAGRNTTGTRTLMPLMLAIILPGVMTAALDIRNTSDIHNSRFTSYVSYEEMRMHEWVRRNIPANQTVQDFPGARTWNLSAVPPFSGRPTVIGDRMHGRIFQVSPDEYEQRLKALRTAMAGLPGSAPELRRLGVDYIFWGEDEKRFFKLDPGLPMVHRIGGTALYSLNPEKLP
jgi:hypothetical protein